MRIALLTLASALAALPAAAQQPGVPVPEAVAEAQSRATVPIDPRVNQLIVYGDDPCPQSTNDEIIVCARLPENDRYRIPSSVRDSSDDPASQSWANRAIELSYTGRSGTDSCSPTGPGGFTGCFNQIVAQGRAEHAQAGDINWTRAIEQARRDREQRIGEAQVEEDEENRPD